MRYYDIGTYALTYGRFETVFPICACFTNHYSIAVPTAAHRVRSLARWHAMDAEFDRERGWASRGVQYVDGNDQFEMLSRKIFKSLYEKRISVHSIVDHHRHASLR